MQNKNNSNNMNYPIFEIIKKYDLEYELLGWYLNQEGKKKYVDQKVILKLNQHQK